MSIISNNIPNPTVPLIDSNGRLSTVWFQFFLTLFARTGNGIGQSADDLLSEAQQGAIQADVASANALIAIVESLAQQAMAAAIQRQDERGESGDSGMLVASLVQKVAELEARIESMSPPMLTDTAQLTNGAQFLAEGKPIGSITPSTGAFTTLLTTGNLTVGNGSASIAYFPGYSAGTPQYRIVLNHAGANLLGVGSDGVSSMIFGTGTAPAGAVVSTWATLGTAGLAVTSGFGCNGKSAQPTYALGPAATDAASTQALANNIRTALLNNGIGA